MFDIEKYMSKDGEYIEISKSIGASNWILTVRNRGRGILTAYEIDPAETDMFAILEYCNKKEYTAVIVPEGKNKLKRPNVNDIVFAEPTGDVYQNEIAGDDYDPVENQLYFIMADEVHEFAIGLTTILSCIKFAEQNGEIPVMPESWWLSVIDRYESALAGSFLDERL